MPSLVLSSSSLRAPPARLHRCFAAPSSMTLVPLLCSAPPSSPLFLSASSRDHGGMEEAADGATAAARSAELVLPQQSVREAKIWGASEEHCSAPVCRPDDDQLRKTGQQHNGQTSSANLQICFYLCKEIVC